MRPGMKFTKNPYLVTCCWCHTWVRLAAEPTDEERAKLQGFTVHKLPHPSIWPLESEKETPPTPPFQEHPYGRLDTEIAMVLTWIEARIASAKETSKATGRPVMGDVAALLGSVAKAIEAAQKKAIGGGK